MPLATIEAPTFDNITSKRCLFQSNITDVGSSTVTRRGFVYDEFSIPNPGNVPPEGSDYQFFVDETGSFSTGAFDYFVETLSVRTTYRVRAFAQNADAYSYSNEASFSTHVGTAMGIRSPSAAVNLKDAEPSFENLNKWAIFFCADNAENPEDTARLYASHLGRVQLRNKALDLIFFMNPETEEAKIAGVDFDNLGLWTEDDGDFVGLQTATGEDTKVIFAGATDRRGSNAKFYVTPAGGVFHPSITTLLLSQAGTAANTVDAVVDSGIEWKHTGPTLGVKAAVYYIHRFGINRIYFKYQRRLTNGSDTGRIRLSLRPQGGGSPIDTQDDDFTGSTSYTTQTLGIDVSGLTANTVYTLDVAIGAWLGPNPPNGEIHVLGPIMYGTAIVES